MLVASRKASCWSKNPEDGLKHCVSEEIKFSVLYFLALGHVEEMSQMAASGGILFPKYISLPAGVFGFSW